MPKNPVLSDHYLITFQLSQVRHVSTDPTLAISFSPGLQMLLLMSSQAHLYTVGIFLAPAKMRTQMQVLLD